jgi:hypothetical protein
MGAGSWYQNAVPDAFYLQKQLKLLFTLLQTSLRVYVILQPFIDNSPLQDAHLSTRVAKGARHWQQ